MAILDFLPRTGASTLALAQRKLDEVLARRSAGDPVANGVLMQAESDKSSVVLDFLLSVLRSPLSALRILIRMKRSLSSGTSTTTQRMPMAFC